MNLTNNILMSFLIAGSTLSSLAVADSPPSTPTNVSAQFYAGAGGELFWNRSTDDRAVRAYEVAIDGNVIGEFDALSYYDPTLQENITYTFTVIAIDSTGQRSTEANFTLNAIESPDISFGAPSSPAQLRSSVYSSTSAELFWDRPVTPGLQYEVRVDGQFVAITDGVSYYMNSLPTDRIYDFEVIAINKDGQRSTPAAIQIATVAATANDTDTDTSAPATGLPEYYAPSEFHPQNLSIQRYSSTAAELFWTPAIRFRPRVYKNEIVRNGILIATVEGESLRSYLDDDRTPGEFYIYEVIAVSAAGRASAIISDADAEISLPAEAPTGITPATDLPADLLTKLNTTFDIINGVGFEKVIATLGRLADTESRASIGLVSASTNADLSETFICPNGGELFVRPSDSASEQRFSWFLTGTDCAIGPIVFSGRADIGRTNTSDGSFSPSSLQLTDVELEDSRDLSKISSDQMYFFADETNPRFSRWFSDNVIVDRPLNSYSYSSASGSGRDTQNGLPDGTFGLTMSANSVTGLFSESANMRTLGPFEFVNGRENARPNAGRISIESGRNSLFINASNGDPSTFTLTNTANGSTSSYNIEFSETYRFEVPILEGVDVGF